MIEESTTPAEPSSVVISGCRTTRIYCRPGCPAGKRMKPENRVSFQSREEARTNGYRSCKVCMPDAPDATPETFFLTRYNSTLGTYIIGSSERGVVCVEPEDRASALLARWERGGIRIQDGSRYNDTVIYQLEAYFAKRLRQFDVTLDLRGTPFQREVWNQLCQIPYGETWSYRQLAQALGRVNSARAVGRANGRNPVSIIVPCHRVIGANGDLIGYRGGLHRKRALLDLETGVVSKGSA